ncbi:MAG: hypothetical protein P1U74_02730 [Legionellaceae bacterium]|nr:hypothetical protein [Legionellaceae bacterium]
MMKWEIPAKTFLVGEYVALVSGPSIVLTTSPCFEVSLSEKPGLDGIHPDSPAGVWWRRQDIKNVGLKWYDPYNGMGGMGASSAQFLGAFYATSYLNNKTVDTNSIFDAYLDSSWNKTGIAPSGYDVIAQSLGGCAYLNRDKNIYQSLSWNFSDLGFILIHTGKKLATHHHLQKMNGFQSLDELSSIIGLALSAFMDGNGASLIYAVNSYHEELLKLDLVAKHSIEMINELRKIDKILAVKGCGALGADVLLVIIPSCELDQKHLELNSLGWNVIASSKNLYFST